MLPSIAIAAFNHVLDGESWACNRLQSFAGKSIHLSIFPLIDLNIVIQTDGKLAIASPVNASTDTTLIVAPSLLPRLISRDESAFDEIKIMGDTTFANELLFISKNLYWDIEQDISSIFGDVLAHRMVKAGQNLIHWQSESMLNLSQALIEYLTEEKSVLSNHTDIDRFTIEVNLLQDHVTHLEKRIYRLINLLPFKAEKNISL
ncbi:SCP2 domain-containing protein [Nitrosomonas sp. Is37]|uniref:ubiquinone biosynthesis accessory factor UbiJ n=1 Tax=Nitrosomonas sp. Is37 TaxID=3080535 RepID=UPI00294B6E68|nr:SCP2 sterol-binding domain-containing protein [Nitrosomonas sp. Is37]MDV6345457.1 ubiquinone biosynthesis protein [Nitrosomonas sp. Is37]